MKILSLELKGYKRLSLNKIEYLKFTPQSKIQLILGTNGSGKSSLLKELTPLPATPGEYHKGGFKIIEISHRNSHYVLKSLFNTNGNRFHFIKDGVDLMGDGGTATVYRDLVKQEFGVTADIHKLLIGAIKFTEIDASKRRGWMTQFSDADYTYAFRYYQRLKDQHRDIVGAVKLQQARLVQESEKLLKPEEEARYREDIRVLNEILHGFLEAKTPGTMIKTEILRNIERLDGVIEEITKTLIKSRGNFMLTRESFSDQEEITSASIQIQADIQATQQLIDNLCEKIEQQHKALAALKSTNVQSIADIDRNIDIYQIAIAGERNKLHFDFEFEDSQSVLDSLNSIYENLSEVLIQIEPNPERTFSRENYIATVERVKQQQLTLAEIERQQAQGEAKKKELEHLRTHDKTECPKCNHVWYKGYDEVSYNRLVKELAHASKTHEKLSGEHKADQEHLEKAKTYQDLYRAYITITRAVPSLTPFWDHIVEENLIFENPRAIVTKMESLRADLMVGVKVAEFKAKFKENLDLKILLSRDQNNSLLKIQEESDAADKELYNLTRRLQDKKQRLAELKQLSATAALVAKKAAELEELLNARDQFSEKLHEGFKREALNECIMLTQDVLANREQAISKINIQKALVESIQTQIAELTEKGGVLKLAVQELSPTEGLIAKGLTGFINHFVAQVNSFIKKVWLYPMELIPIQPDEDEDLDLDYKFQVCVNDDKANPIPDIADTSSGMKEIIDLAFRIVSMQYLKLNESPIYLDEFGKALDSAHRDSVHYVITNLLTSANFSQIYMISHYEHSYGSLANTDIMVLCEQNIQLAPGSVFNKHVEMK